MPCPENGTTPLTACNYNSKLSIGHRPKIFTRAGTFPATSLSICLLTVLSFWFFGASTAFAAQVSLSWQAKSSPVPDGYSIYCRTQRSQYDYRYPVWTGRTTTTTIKNLADNTTYYFIVRSFKGSDESDDSNEVAFHSSSTGTSSTSGSTSSTTSSTSTNSGTGTVIIDDGKSGTSAVGTWLASGASSPYGGRSLYSKQSGTSYTYQASLSGSYEVSIWWTEYNSRCSNVPVKIYDGTRLLETVYVDQRDDGGRWNYLGNYDFSGKAKIVVESRSSTCSTCADAVELTKAGSTSAGSADVIVDDGKSGTSTVGTWQASGASSPYGARSLYSKQSGARYTYQSSLSGSHDVSIWWTEYKSRCSNVPVKIYDGTRLLETVYVDQRDDGGRWNYLGNYDFSGKAKIVVESRSSTCSTCADAVLYSK